MYYISMNLALTNVVCGGYLFVGSNFLDIDLQALPSIYNKLHLLSENKLLLVEYCEIESSKLVTSPFSYFLLFPIINGGRFIDEYSPGLAFNVNFLFALNVEIANPLCIE